MDGEKVRDARAAAGLSMRELEGRSGVKIITIHRIETGKVTRAYPSTIRKLAEALGLVPMDLMIKGRNRDDLDRPTGDRRPPGSEP